jgi:hypothetical protein
VLIYRAAAEGPRDAKGQGRAVETAKKTPHDSNSIAVLPFTNISNDPDSRVFLRRNLRKSRPPVMGGGEYDRPDLVVCLQGGDYGIERISALLRGALRARAAYAGG